MNWEDDKVDGRVERARRRREKTQQEILLAASQCFARKGFHATSIKDILAEAGIARGTFYIHFQSKQRIFEELMGELLMVVRDSLPRLSLAPDAPPIQDQLVDNISALFGMLIERRFMVTILARGTSGPDAEMRAQIGSVFDQICELVAKSLQTGFEMGIIREVPLKTASLLVMGAVKEVLLHAVTDDAMNESAFREMIRDLTHLCFEGLGVSP